MILHKLTCLCRLMSQPNTLTQRTSCHVWNRLLTSNTTPEFFAKLNRLGMGLWCQVARDEGGSLIIQRMCEEWPDAHTSVVAQELLDGMPEVACTPCGPLWVLRPRSHASLLGPDDLHAQRFVKVWEKQTATVKVKGDCTDMSIRMQSTRAQRFAFPSSHSRARSGSCA